MHHIFTILTKQSKRIAEGFTEAAFHKQNVNLTGNSHYAICNQPTQMLNMQLEYCLHVPLHISKCQPPLLVSITHTQLYLEIMVANMDGWMKIRNINKFVQTGPRHQTGPQYKRNLNIKRPLPHRTNRIIYMYCRFFGWIDCAVVSVSDS